MLRVSNLDVYYGESHVIRDVSLTLGDTEAVALMGRNGVGKTTFLKSLIGMLSSKSGAIELNGEQLHNKPSYERVKAGLAFVPQGRMVFPLLTVEENILSGMTHLSKRVVPDYIYHFFPVLREMSKRKGGNLSGGQQQMMVIARALVSDPKVLILDEPTEGIQPSIIKELAVTLTELRRERKFAIIVSEQVLSFALDVADRFLVMDRGEIVHERVKEEVDIEVMRSFLTV